MNDLGNLLQMIYDLLSGWFTSFTSHATAVMEKLNLIEDDTDTIVSNTSDIADDTNDIKDNTGAIITPVQSIKTNTDSIKNDTTTIKNNVSTMTNQLGTISTNVGTASAFTEDVANNTLDIKDKVITIASDTTQIRSNTNTVITDMSKVYEALKWSLIDKVTTETVEGTDTVSFDTDLTNDLVSLEVGLVCTQSGTGDPSPDNIRPINGYSNITLNVNGNTVIISLGNTYYVGVIDVTNGKLKVMYSGVDLGSLEYSYTGNIFYSTSAPLFGNGGKAKINFGTNFNNLCEIYKNLNVPLTNPINNSFMIANTTTNPVLRIADSRYTVPSDLKTALSGVMAIIELSIPIEINLTPEVIATIKGINTITTDTSGKIVVTYEETVKHYLDKQEA